MSLTRLHQDECLLGYVFFLFCDITQQYHEKFIFIFVAVIVVVNAFQLYLAIDLSFQCNIFHGSF